METKRLNTKYDIEYYRIQYNKYQDLIIELQSKRVEQWEKILMLSDENKLLRSKIKELENKRAYSVKLQISK